MNTPLIDTVTPAGAWEIAGIQHEIFLRVLAGLRHELVGPISVSRMAISVLKRTLDKGDPGKEAIQQQVARMDEQMQQSVLGIRELSVWDADNSAIAPIDEIVRHGLKLMGYRLSMRGILVDDDAVTGNEVSGDESPEDNSAVPANDVSNVPHQAFLYAWLGLLGHIEDCHYPATITISQELPTVLSIRVIPGTAKAQEPPIEIKPNLHRIDQQAVSALAGHSGMFVRFSPDQISFGWNQ